MKQPEEFDMGDQWDLVYHRLQIAEEDYETAELLMQGERYRGANNRAYYSIYHTIDAVLSIHGVAFKRHKDTLAYFNIFRGNRNISTINGETDRSGRRNQACK